MRDVSAAFELAARQERSPMSDQSDQLAREISTSVGAWVEWEWGEDWASLVRDDVLLAHVYVLIPLVICIHSVEEAVRSVVGPAVPIITVHDMIDEEVRSSVEALRLVFGTEDEGHWGELNPDAFSAQDLWFHTI